MGRPFEDAPEPGRAKLFSHGGSQAVRLPKAFRLEGDEVTVRREGDAVILEPKRRQGGAALWARIDAIEVDEPLPYPEQPRIREITFDP
ncbi:MAG: AbrB/MazE/SpoVT family DNA-binding domain-containing protein [Caulobacteraceae bacterium]|nr:AbrB/MazE/SpoVT family DNA-binding domain-containing protein [Caulobacteraceae bacterium]